MKPETRETMHATMHPDMYGGKGCDELVPRWWCYADGDKDGDYEHRPLKLDAKLFPPGTRVSVREPVCPECGDARSPILPTPAKPPYFDPKCDCGFDWDAWVANEYS